MLTAFALLRGGDCAFAQRVVIIHPEHPRQTFEGWGTSLAWFANRAGGWTEQNRNRLAHSLFDSGQGLGLTYVRFNVGGGDAPDNPKPILLPQNKMSGYERSDGTYDWSADENQRWFLLKAYSLGAQLSEAVSYSPPYWMTISGTTQGSVDGLSNMQQRFYGRNKGSFADYLIEVVKHYHDAWGVTFRTLAPMNESEQTWWRAGDQKQEGCHFSTQEQERVIQDVAAQLSAKGLRTAVAASDENDLDVEAQELAAYNSDTLRSIAQVTTHTYAGSERKKLRASAQALGKRLSMSEWGAAPDPEGRALATQITKDLAELGAANWSIWQPDWPELLKLDYDNQSFETTPSYGVYEQFTRFIRPGAQIISVDDPLTLVAYDARTSNLVLVSQNWKENDEIATYSILGIASSNTKVSAYRFSSGSMQRAGGVRFKSSFVRAVLPAHSITTIVISRLELQHPRPATKAAVDPPHFAGVWKSAKNSGNSQERSSQQPNDTYSIAFDGTQARILGTLSPLQGIAGFSVDGGAETDLSLYAVREQANVVLFSTPELPPGQHRIAVRVTGLKEVSAKSSAILSGRLQVLETPQ